jgi:hypothetical protein
VHTFDDAISAAEYLRQTPVGLLLMTLKAMLENCRRHISGAYTAAILYRLAR